MALILSCTWDSPLKQSGGVIVRIWPPFDLRPPEPPSDIHETIYSIANSPPGFCLLSAGTVHAHLLLENTGDASSANFVFRNGTTRFASELEPAYSWAYPSLVDMNGED